MIVTFKQSDKDIKRKREEYREYVNNEALKAIVRLSGIFLNG